LYEDFRPNEAFIKALRGAEMNDLSGELSTRVETLHDQFIETLRNPRTHSFKDSPKTLLLDMMNYDLGIVRAGTSKQITFLQPLPSLTEGSYQLAASEFVTGEPAWTRARMMDELRPANAIQAARQNLAGIDLSDVTLKAKTFRLGSSFDFHEASLEFSDFSRASLDGVNFLRAKLGSADFRGAHLKNIDFRGADLLGADFTGATLENCDLRDTDLTGANLKGVDLKSVDLRGVTYDDETFVTLSYEELLTRTGWTFDRVSSGFGKPIFGKYQAKNRWFEKYRMTPAAKFERSLKHIRETWEMVRDLLRSH
jgi:hypothetical protein